MLRGDMVAMKQLINDIPIVIAAGGNASRMGASKPTQIVDGYMLLSRALEYAHRLSSNVAVAVRSADQVGGIVADNLIFDHLQGEGPINGILSAFAFAEKCRCDFVLIIGCDMPLLPANLQSCLSHALSDNGAAIARSAGKLHPTAGLWRTNQDGLNAYIASGRRSLIGFAETIGYCAIDWDTNPFDPFFNVNRPEDILRAEAIIRTAAQFRRSPDPD
jgi:molybdenum cofactor guanylyltransferase